MQAQTTTARHGLYVCEACRDNPDDENGCGDQCGYEWADELPPLALGLDCWPVCRCCGRNAQLVAPLVRSDVPVLDAPSEV